MDEAIHGFVKLELWRWPPLNCFFSKAEVTMSTTRWSAKLKTPANYPKNPIQRKSYNSLHRNQKSIHLFTCLPTWVLSYQDSFSSSVRLSSSMKDVILSITQAFISKSSYKCINMNVDQHGRVEALQRKQKSRELKHLKYFCIAAVMLSVCRFVTGKETFKKWDLWSGRNDRQWCNQRLWHVSEV